METATANKPKWIKTPKQLFKTFVEEKLDYQCFKDWDKKREKQAISSTVFNTGGLLE